MSEKNEAASSHAETWRLRSTTLDDSAWLNLLGDEQHHGLYDRAWVKAVSDGLQFSSVVLILEKCGRTIAGTIGYRRKVAGARLMYIGYPYGQIVGRLPEGDVFRSVVLEWAKANGVDRVRIPTFPASDANGLSGFKTIPMATQIIDLSGVTRSDLWDGLSASTRRNVRRAQKSGVEIVESSGSDHVDQFFGLYLNSMKRNRALAKIGKSFVRASLSMKGDHVACTALLARLQGVPIAGVLILDAEKGSYYLMGGSRSDMLEYRPNDFLFWHAIDRSLGRGSKWFDFLPSGSAGQELVRFKAKWGARSAAADVLQLDVSPARMAVWDWAYRASENTLIRRFIDLARKG